jgi:hypothetical protein
VPSLRRSRLFRAGRLNRAFRLSYDGDNVDGMKALAAALLAALTLAGCGSESGGGGGGDGGGDAGAEQGAAYEAAFDICAGGVKATAEAYAVEANDDAVASVVVEQVSGGSARDEDSARRGCLDALKKADGS